MSRSFRANGNISPMRFVKPDATKTGGYVLQAGTGDRTIGVSQTGTRNPPVGSLDDGYAGVQETNTVEVLTYTESGVVWLEVGAAVTFGDLLKSDTDGKGVTASADGDWYGARALQTATAATQLVEVELVSGYRGA